MHSEPENKFYRYYAPFIAIIFFYVFLIISSFFIGKYPYGDDAWYHIAYSKTILSSGLPKTFPLETDMITFYPPGFHILLALVFIVVQDWYNSLYLLLLIETLFALVVFGFLGRLISGNKTNFIQSASVVTLLHSSGAFLGIYWPVPVIYSLLFSLLSFYAYVTMLKNDTNSIFHILIFIVSFTLALFTHFFGIFFLPSMIFVYSFLGKVPLNDRFKTIPLLLIPQAIYFFLWINPYWLSQNYFPFITYVSFFPFTINSGLVLKFIVSLLIFLPSLITVLSFILLNVIKFRAVNQKSIERLVYFLLMGTILLAIIIPYISSRFANVEQYTLWGSFTNSLSTLSNIPLIGFIFTLFPLSIYIFIFGVDFLVLLGIKLRKTLKEDQEYGVLFLYSLTVLFFVFSLIIPFGIRIVLIIIFLFALILNDYFFSLYTLVENLFLRFSEKKHVKYTNISFLTIALILILSHGYINYLNVSSGSNFPPNDNYSSVLEYLTDSNSSSISLYQYDYYFLYSMGAKVRYYFLFGSNYAEINEFALRYKISCLVISQISIQYYKSNYQLDVIDFLNLSTIVKLYSNPDFDIYALS